MATNQNSLPADNAARLRGICDINPSSRINIASAWARAIADQLEGLEAENKKNLKLLRETELRLAVALRATAQPQK